MCFSMEQREGEATVAAEERRGYLPVFCILLYEGVPGKYMEKKERVETKRSR